MVFASRTNRRKQSYIFILILISFYSGLSAQTASDLFRDDFSRDQGSWQPYFEPGEWTLQDGNFTSTGSGITTGRIAKISPAADIIVDTEFQLGNSDRKNIGIIFRAQTDLSCYVVRYYDRDQVLELLRYDKGSVTSQQRGGAKISLDRGRWYRLKVVAIDDLILAKLWPATEPAKIRWQLITRISNKTAGLVGLYADDNSKVSFRNFKATWSKSSIESIRKDLAQEKQKLIKRMQEALELEVKATSFVLRTQRGPERLLLLRTILEGTSEPVSGEIIVRGGNIRKIFTVTPKQLKNGYYEISVPEPANPLDLEISFSTSINKILKSQLVLKPARHWTFYMTPHTHFDVGFTDLQPKVIKQLSDDMELAVRYCEETKDWPAECQYRWTVEVTGLMKNYIDRHSKEEVETFMKWVRQGRIEICGYYLNMPTELVGHEELIRCLYYAQELRRQYQVPIDTVMIDDVPGYTWALPDILVGAGMDKVAFRANSIHAQFLWYRDNAVPRPCYWQGPAGSKVLFWYTDSYREGNFFRSPGLHEGSFLSIIRRNEQAGCWVDDIQLRMGGDNLPPDLDASKNSRAWNEKYIWPKVVVATNREYLEVLERKYGSKCQTFRGDIPSWWAEGPASSAYETGMNRQVHDQLVATESMLAWNWLADSRVKYPRKTIHDAYDKMLYYDEHTWGASSSIRQPQSEQTVKQWQWKADRAYQAKKLADDLSQQAIQSLAQKIACSGPREVAIWNPLAWPRTDVVELDLGAGPLKGVKGISIVDTRTGKPVQSQISAETKNAYFMAQNVPAMGYVRYEIKPAAFSSRTTTTTQGNILENKFYRLTWSPETGGWSHWYDKELKRELIDPKSKHRFNQGIYETPLGGNLNDSRRGRDVIERKRPVTFKRVSAQATDSISSRQGNVFRETTTIATLPTCPKIKQTIRIYNDLKVVDIVNIVTKEEIYTPEGVYFAFPFDVKEPEFRVQIADAIMRPGKDQLPLSCYDFYSIQHWADVEGDGFGISLAPLDSPLAVFSDLNVYKWADKLLFDKGYIYSWVMNNYWYTNFKAGQKGDLVFRYRLTSYQGKHDSVKTTQFAWQRFFPLEPIWLTSKPNPGAPTHSSMIEMAGDPVIISCIKMAEADEAVIVRLLEHRGKASSCTLKFNLPHNRKFTQAFLSNIVEEPIKKLNVLDNSLTLHLRAHEILTVRLIP